MYELHWGLPVILYLFLGGLGAGAGAVSASVMLRNGATSDGPSADIARWGALIAPLPVMIGTGMIVFELGSFQAGDWFKWINLFTTINMSPMSIGSWVLGLFILVSLAYAYTYLERDLQPDDPRHGLRRALAWLMAPLGIAVALYTGIMLGATPARPFWNTPALAILFTISALSTGVASILLIRALMGGGSEEVKEKPSADAYWLTRSDTALIGLEMVIVVLLLLSANLSFSHVESAFAIILGGDLTALFWIGFVAVGLVVPIVIELRYVIPTLLYQKVYTMPRATEILVCALVLIGGFLLRYIVVIAGQMTGPGVL